MVHIVKRKGHREEYDSRKVYGSSYAAARNVHLSNEESEKIAEKVTADLDRWIKGKEGVTSEQIFDEVTKSLRKYNEDASFMYETHRDVW